MASNPIVRTRNGEVEGLRRRGVQVYRGIPYAQPPRGVLRFQAPVAPKPWAGVLSGRRFGPSAPQFPPAMLLVRRAIGAAESQQSQDCLYLNVWTPEADGRRRPVMVWIHGGAFILGSGSAGLYDGAQLARNGDAVVVTINYRLGALGFLNLNEIFPGAAAANPGMLDQIAALEWVRDNIEAFGGDPENVTIFGESAGGMSVGTLLGIPAARGLFHRAILQSGAAANVSTPAEATRVAETFLELFGGANLSQLQRAPVSALLAAQQKTTVQLGIELGTLPWQPSVDGDLIPEQPLAAIANGHARRVPVLVGSNRDEWKLFMLADRSARSLTEDSLRRRLARALPDREERGRTLAQHALEHYSAALQGGRRPVTPTDIWEAFQSDRIFHYPALRVAEEHCAHEPKTWSYLFGYSPPAMRQRMGACHGIDIPFIFGTLKDPALRPLTAFAPQARKLSEQMQRAWIEFSRCGDPRHDGIPSWPAFDAEKDTTMLFTRNTRVVELPFAERLRFWREFEAAEAGTPPVSQPVSLRQQRS